MSDANKGLDAIAKWQSETRQEIINEMGSAILKALHKLGFQAEADEPEVIRKPRQRKPRRSRKPLRFVLRTGTDMERVFKTIQKHPGNKGFQIQALLAQAGSVIHERTMRTCLNRLRTRGYIEQRDKAWFPTEGHQA